LFPPGRHGIINRDFIFDGSFPEIDKTGWMKPGKKM
jgi:hypothetical protein